MAALEGAGCPGFDRPCPQFHPTALQQQGSSSGARQSRRLTSADRGSALVTSSFCGQLPVCLAARQHHLSLKPALLCFCRAGTKFSQISQFPPLCRRNTRTALSKGRKNVDELSKFLLHLSWDCSKITALN